MKKSVYPISTFAILFLFFFQMAGTLISSIYTLDLLHTSLDAKALGVLFFFAPVIFVVIRKKFPNWLTWCLFSILLGARGITPYLDTNGRMLSSGVSTAAVLCLLPLLVKIRIDGEQSSRQGGWASVGLATAVALSVMLRTMNSGIDYSLTGTGSWVGWILCVLLGVTLAGLKFEQTSNSIHPKNKGITASILGIFMVLTLMYFAFSAPAVLARWTEVNYAGIVLCVSLFSLGWVLVALSKPVLFKRITNQVLIGWNLLFSLALIGTILAQRVSFPANPDSAAVVVGAPTFFQQIPLIFLMLLFPVLYFDMLSFWGKLQTSEANPGQMAGGMLLGSFSLVLLVFMNIFTNVWGYVAPISPFFRNKFWLPFLVICGLLCVMVILLRKESIPQESKQGEPLFWVWSLLLVGILVITANGLFVKMVNPDPHASINSLIVMTYNIQQGNDSSGEQSYLRQLENIKKVSPDVLAIQEGDSTRISLNNIDLIRYFADKLGYYSYYGPTTVTGGYGTAILSRFPLKNTQAFFTFSDQDENGTAEAQIEVDGKIFTFYNVHPDGTDEAKLALARIVLDRSEGQEYVIILGDFNMRDYDAGYQLIDSVFTNSWISVFPSGISTDGVDMTGKNRIDHIFISKNLLVRDPVYLLPPASATDHPLHWAVIYWDK
jgi:endonuclease/exonuclease/phosphatase family metal-dependent hydrolase